MDANAAVARAIHDCRHSRSIRRFLAVAIVVIVINLCWQFFRAWMPKMLGEQYQYDAKCRSVLFDWILHRGRRGVLVDRVPHEMACGPGPVRPRRQVTTFFLCSLLTALSVVAAGLPASGLLLATLLIIGFGSLGQFPNYYAFTQELSARRMGNITGVLSFLTWMVHALVQEPIGRWLDQTHRYGPVMLLAGLMPLIGLLAIVLLWNPWWRHHSTARPQAPPPLKAVPQHHIGPAPHAFV